MGFIWMGPYILFHRQSLHRHHSQFCPDLNNNDQNYFASEMSFGEKTVSKMNNLSVKWGIGIECKNLPNGLYANPYDCTTFYQCSNGVAYLFDCPDDLQWSSKLQRCEWPANSDCGVIE
ncbi:Carbohydrate-Binding Module Family 14 protein [Gigaspora rosea]|uniref:Carbohydrate-Binding Module Family 14 protein n=1 Tax=Gigaspora rosea TaxID=44941 RepID=A0A397U0Q7_9GLOM|nr:Carbohydrate-Binding Module Family 14 protein [Gigaspora rosea]